MTYAKQPLAAVYTYRNRQGLESCIWEETWGFLGLRSFPRRHDNYDAPTTGERRKMRENYVGGLGLAAFPPNRSY